MIKCVMVDMDGTFLSKGNDYNRERFARVYQLMKEQKIRFVVASGNQYDQISSFFEDDNIYYAAENGAWISYQGKDLYTSYMDFDAAMEIFHVIDQLEHVDACICGKKSAYVLEERLVPRMSICFPTIQVIDDVSEIKDQLFKIALETPMEKTEEIREAIMNILPASMEAVNSGFGCIDINQKGIDKGSALDHLCDYFQIEARDVMAFGDSGNDLAMIEKAGVSVAMGNAQDRIKSAARFVAPSCQEEGVLVMLERYFSGEWRIS